MIKVSVIVPVYNVEQFLPKCLESIINQSLEDIEIICINDGSTDNSLSILENYALMDSRIKIIDKKNEGQSVARNLGIEMSQGEYLGFVDADDWIDFDFFEKLYNTAKKCACDIATAGFKRYKKSRFKVSKFFEAELVCTNVDDKARLDCLPAHNYIWNKIYKRTVWFENNIKFQSGRYYEDMALVIKILNTLGKMVTVPNTYYNYRMNSNSTVSQKTIKHVSDYEWAFEELFNYAKLNNIKLDLKNVVKKKEYYKMFNLTLLKVYHYFYRTEYKLLGFIPFITKQVA